MNPETHAAMMALGGSYALAHSGVLIDGMAKLDFSRYPFIPAIIDEEKAHRITIIKGAQMGFTIACIMKVLQKARQGTLRGIGYFFPAEGEVSDFAKARFGPMMSNNYELWGRYVQDTDSAALKRIGQTHLYFRGMGQRGTGASTRSKSKQKSIPLDWIVLDERDEMDDTGVDAIEHRLDASSDPMTIVLSTPTLPQYGVDLDYTKSDQRVWMWRCTHCNEWQCLDLTYPDCIAEPVGKDPYYQCTAPRCRREIYRTEGQWVARKLDVKDHAGFWVSQLSSPTSDATKIVLATMKAQETGRQKEFQNQNLARAYAEVDEEITRQQLEDLLLPAMPKPLRHSGPCAMGVDPGKIHWYTVRERITDKDSICIARGRADSYEELDAVCKRFNVQSGVMDAGYDPSAVMAFVKAHPGWYGSLYVGNRKREPAWDHHERMVQIGRTRTLDDARNAIIQKRVMHVQKDEFWDRHFVPQMTNLKRATIIKDQTGEEEGVWVVTGGQKNDHLRHADAYCNLAVERVGLSQSVQEMRNRTQSQEGSGRPRSPWTM